MKATKNTYFCNTCGTSHSIRTSATANIITRECIRTGKQYTKFVKKEHYENMKAIGIELA